MSSYCKFPILLHYCSLLVFNFYPQAPGQGQQPGNRGGFGAPRGGGFGNSRGAPSGRSVSVKF